MVILMERKSFGSSTGGYGSGSGSSSGNRGFGGGRRFGGKRDYTAEYADMKDEKPKEVKPKEKIKVMPKSLSKPAVIKSKAGKVIHVTSKRKRAIARASIKAGKGRIVINKIPYKNIQNKYILDLVQEPIVIIEEHNKDLPHKVDIDVVVKGGGTLGQMFAVRNAIAKAFVQYSDDLELTQKLLDYNRAFLVDDARRVEAKKPLGRKARAKKQHSKR